MIQLDLVKYMIPMFINYLKSHIQGEAKPWDWDPFNIFLKNPNPTATTTPPPPSWTKLFFHVSLLLLLLSFASMNVTVTRLRAPPLYLFILGSLFLPQALFWYAYAAVAACLVMTKLQPPCSSFHADSTATTTVTTVDDQSQSSHVPQVVIDISPQNHDDSDAEADDEALLLM